jgi:hypothetical protein
MANFKKITTWLRYLQGLWRHAANFCPQCNSDAPALDSCPICQSARTWEERLEQKEERWARFITHLHLLDRVKSWWHTARQRARILAQLDRDYLEALIREDWERATQLIKRYIHVKHL